MKVLSLDCWNLRYFAIWGRQTLSSIVIHLMKLVIEQSNNWIFDYLEWIIETQNPESFHPYSVMISFPTLKVLEELFKNSWRVHQEFLRKLEEFSRVLQDFLLWAILGQRNRQLPSFYSYFVFLPLIGFPARLSRYVFLLQDWALLQQLPWVWRRCCIPQFLRWISESVSISAMSPIFHSSEFQSTIVIIGFPMLSCGLSVRSFRPELKYDRILNLGFSTYDLRPTTYDSSKLNLLYFQPDRLTGTVKSFHTHRLSFFLAFSIGTWAAGSTGLKTGK